MMILVLIHIVVILLYLLLIEILLGIVRNVNIPVELVVEGLLNVYLVDMILKIDMVPQRIVDVKMDIMKRINFVISVSTLVLGVLAKPAVYTVMLVITVVIIVFLDSITIVITGHPKLAKNVSILVKLVMDLTMMNAIVINN